MVYCKIVLDNKIFVTKPKSPLTPDWNESFLFDLDIAEITVLKLIFFFNYLKKLLPKLRIFLYELNSSYSKGEKLIAECERINLLEYLMKPQCEFSLKAFTNVFFLID